MKMRVVIILFLLLAPLYQCGNGVRSASAISDDDFAEFEDDSEFDFEVNDDQADFEDDGDVIVEEEEEEEEEEYDFNDIDADMEVEDEDEGFEVDMDEDEFEKQASTGKVENIKLSESTAKMGPVWKNYVLEMVVVAGMVIYLAKFFIGRSKNSSLAYGRLNNHMDTLTANFAVVGDNGEGDDPGEPDLIKENDDSYTLWCSGRQNCAGMLMHMEFCRRHDLMSVFLGLMRPVKKDQFTIIFQLGEEDEMDSFVMALGQKKPLQKIQKEYEDLKNYCSNLRPVNNMEPLFQLSEISEATSSFLSERNRAFLSRHADVVESIHISDQYTGLVQDTDDSETVVVRKPEKRIKITFNASDVEKEKACLKFALQVLDQVRIIRLSRESRDKAVKKRISVSTSLDKLQHTQRQEAAQQRKEDKIRARKEKTMLLSESDPDRARKLEEKENKRARKKMQPKVKSMKLS